MGFARFVVDRADDVQDPLKIVESLFELLTLPMDTTNVEQGEGLAPWITDLLADA